MDIAAARVALANAARAIEGLNCFEYAPDDIPAPAFFVSDYTVEYNHSFATFNSPGSSCQIEFTALILVSRTHDRESQAYLDDILSPTSDRSIKRALEAARGGPGENALGGVCDDFRVSRVQGYRWYTHGTVTYLGAEIIIPAWGRGDG